MLTGNSSIRVLMGLLVLTGLPHRTPVCQSQERAKPLATQENAAADRPITENRDEVLGQLQLDADKLIDFEKLSVDEIKREMELRRRGQKFALQGRIEAVEAEYAQGIAGASLSAVMNAHADLALFELESAQTAADRVRALRSVVDASRGMETEVRAKRDFGAVGGSTANLMEAMAHRLKWERALAKEVLAMKQAPAGGVNSKPVKSAP